MEQSRDPLAELLSTYSELNSSNITELPSVPSALEFMRHVAQNRPFVVRGAASDWEATRTWDVGLLKELLSGQRVNVAITPKGNADSPTRNQEGELVFLKPLEEEQDFSTYIDFIRDQELNKSFSPTEIRYCQTQNDNLRHEYSLLFSHVAPEIPFARLALQQASPEAINLWIGNSLSVTALHRDNYENLYVQVVGRKHFVLLPPLAYPLVKERVLRAATYVRGGSGRAGGEGEEMLVIKMDDDGDRVPFATWDPDSVCQDEDDGDGDVENENSKDPESHYYGLVKPMRVTLNEGDMLYLPAQWYHKVSQSCSEEGICCAVNYWYDMEFGGAFYPLCNFVRSVSLAGKEKEKEQEKGREGDGLT